MIDKREVARTEDLPLVADWLLKNVRSRIITLEGEMGSGKTTLIRALCEKMGVTDSVSSPTFSLVNEYYSPRYGSIYHFDFYRLTNEEEALDMGLEDYLYSDCYCIIEWPEKICNFLPAECARVKITVQDGKRIFELKTIDE